MCFFESFLVVKIFKNLDRRFHGKRLVNFVKISRNIVKIEILCYSYVNIATKRDQHTSEGLLVRLQRGFAQFRAVSGRLEGLFSIEVGKMLKPP